MEEAIKFLRSKNMLDDNSTEFIIKFPNNVNFDLVKLLDEFKKQNKFNRYPVNN